MRLRIAHLVVALACLLSSALPARAGIVGPAFNAIERPDGKGDQVIFYYDARPNFTTFINLHNDGLSDLTVQILFYGPTFSSPFVRTVALGSGGTTIIDVGALTTATPTALPAQFGVAIATAINEAGKSIVTRALSGNFTVANLQVQSAWGAPGAARSAIFGPLALTEAILMPSIPALGTVIDATGVLLPAVQPTSAHLAVYYNPETLEPAGLGGNQLVFITFEDVLSDTYAAQSAVTEWEVDATRSDGSVIGPVGSFLASGVTVSDVVSVVGAGANGSSGSMSFFASASPAARSRFIFFTETLGTFATGYLLPPIASEPVVF
jgi:hypothetical protein